MNAEPSAEPRLVQLAERLGIESEFEDARGELQRASPETMRRLLNAMGIDAADEREAAASLSALEDSEWRRALPPVSVTSRNTGPATLEIVLPEDTREVKWRIRLESDAELQGSARFNSLTLLARRVAKGARLERRRLILDVRIPDGYHTLQLEGSEDTTLLIVSPGQCWLPDVVESGNKLWGVTLQLYSVRSGRNWGIGDFSDLRDLISATRRAGAHVVGVNPLHALFPDDPKHASPYSPSSRVLLNVLNIDITAIPEYRRCAEVQRIAQSAQFKRRLERCRAATLIQYDEVATLKLPVLAAVFKEFASQPDSARARAFARFRGSQPAAFEQGCLFQVLRQHFAETANTRDWRQWPAEYRDCNSEAVAQFAAEHEGEVAEVAWTQWIAEEQLSEAVRHADDMAVGLYRDLAVGADASGAETWSNPTAFASGVCVGAPPDLYNPAGQNWGLPPMNPRALKAQCYRPFIELLRANMRHSGGLRIDHVMSLLHLYWVPDGCSPAQGAYVRYPFEDLLGILSLESERQQCLVVGEDLGTVPGGLRKRLARAQVLSYRILFFEQDEQTHAYRLPEQYPRLALAASGNHDLPTLRAWWEGADIALKERLDLYPERPELERVRQQREHDRYRLVEALRNLGLLDGAEIRDWRELVGPVHAFLARSTALIATAQLEDITGECDPMNVPGTLAQYPNWRRRVCVALEDLERNDVFTVVSRIFSEHRGDGRSR